MGFFDKYSLGKNKKPKKIRIVKCPHCHNTFLGKNGLKKHTYCRERDNANAE